jgi:hypothetical protein
MSTDVPAEKKPPKKREFLTLAEAAARLDVSVEHLTRRAEASWQRVLGKLEKAVPGAGPDPAPDARAIVRASNLAGMLVDIDMTDHGRVNWKQRGEQLSELMTALATVKGSTPVGAMTMFRDQSFALGQAKISIEAELEWRARMEAHPEEVPFALRARWLSPRKPGAKPIPRTLAAVARQYGLDHNDVALLESAYRIDIEPWGRDTISWSPVLYLLPIGDDLEDALCDDRVPGRWQKAFLAARREESASD